MKQAEYKCNKCGGSDLVVAASCHVEDGQLVPFELGTDSGSGHWCNQCKSETGITARVVDDSSYCFMYESEDDQAEVSVEFYPPSQLPDLFFSDLLADDNDPEFVVDPMAWDRFKSLSVVLDNHKAAAAAWAGAPKSILPEVQAIVIRGTTGTDNAVIAYEVIEALAALPNTLIELSLRLADQKAQYPDG